MQNIKRAITLLVFFYPLSLFAQTTYLPEGSKEYHIIDRLEIKQGNNTELNFSTIKPYSRKSVVEEAEYIDSVKKQTDSKTNLTPVDEYNLQSVLMDNSEWVSGDKESFKSKKSLWNTFYTTKPNLLEVNTKDFFLAINPVLDLQVGGESNNSQNLYYNKRGVTLRGRIANKIGFSTTIRLKSNQPEPRDWPAILSARLFVLRWCSDLDGSAPSSNAPAPSLAPTSSAM